MTANDWLTGAAFTISLAALSSNLTILWLKWPRLIVEVAAQAAVAGDGCAFVVSVINNGSEAITLRSVGLTTETRSHRLDYLATWHAAHTALLPTTGDSTTAMPLRVEAHDCVTFNYGAAATAELPWSTPHRGYATRYRAFRWRPNHPLVRETISRGAVTRHRQEGWTSTTG